MPSGVNLFVKGLWLTCLTFAVVNPAGIRAQDALDRIVAIVGEEIILKSDIDGQVSIMAQQNPGVDKSSPNVR